MKFCDEVKASLVVGDENPLREPRHWRELAAKKLSIPLWTVDADVIVPSKLLEKEQYAARIIRPRLQQRFEQFLTLASKSAGESGMAERRAGCTLCPTTAPSTSPKTGKTSTARCSQSIPFAAAPREALQAAARIRDSQAGHTIPSATASPRSTAPAASRPICTSDTSARTRSRMPVQKSNAPQAAKDDFLDQLITWRELSINFVHFNPLYDSIESAPDWAHQHAGRACSGQAARALHARATRARRNPRRALERRPAADAACRMDAQLHAHVLGQENPGVEPFARGRLPDGGCTSTTNIFWTAAIPTATRESHGRSAGNSTGRGSTGPSSAPFAICQATRRARNSMPTSTSSKWQNWLERARRRNCSSGNKRIGAPGTVVRLHAPSKTIHHGDTEGSAALRGLFTKRRLAEGIQQDSWPHPAESCLKDHLAEVVVRHGLTFGLEGRRCPRSRCLPS